MRTEIEERVGEDTEEADLIALHELESPLVYFATSLRANGVVLEMCIRDSSYIGQAYKLGLDQE